MTVDISKQLSRPVLIAGFGSIGRRHFQNLRQLGVRNFVFYRTRRGTIADVETSAWPSETELADVWRYKPGLAVISNPTADHVPVALEAARHGCDLLIEKPLSASLDGCEDLVAEVESKGLVAQIGCQFRFHPLLVELRQQIQAGALGRIIGARAEWGEYLPAWHPWEDHRRSYSARADLGGGVILTLIHPLDYLFWLFGPAERVQAATVQCPSLQTAVSDDWAEITLNFAEGVVGQVHLDFIQRPPVHRLTVFGDAGRATLDFLANDLTWEIASDERGGRIDRPVEGFERNMMFVDQTRHWLECCQTRMTPRVPLADGVAVLKMALEAKAQAAMIATG